MKPVAPNAEQKSVGKRNVNKDLELESNASKPRRRQSQADPNKNKVALNPMQFGEAPPPLSHVESVSGLFAKEVAAFQSASSQPVSIHLNRMLRPRI